jgi:hypothetical protein
MDVFSTEPEIRLSFVRTLEFRPICQLPVKLTDAFTEGTAQQFRRSLPEIYSALNLFLTY